MIVTIKSTLATLLILANVTIAVFDLILFTTGTYTVQKEVKRDRSENTFNERSPLQDRLSRTPNTFNEGIPLQDRLSGNYEKKTVHSLYEHSPDTENNVEARTLGRKVCQSGSPRFKQSKNELYAQINAMFAEDGRNRRISSHCFFIDSRKQPTSRSRNFGDTNVQQMQRTTTIRKTHLNSAALRTLTKDVAALHTDYSGPKTHPPTNN